MRVALAGAGNIARPYAARIVTEESLELAGATDPVDGRAQALVDEFGGRVYPTLDELLADERVDTVVNLTVPHAHAEVTTAALLAGKHVHSEKPLALRHADAQALVDLAAECGVRLGAAPATLLGEAQQTLWKLVREGRAGRIRVAYAEANWDRLERWHPDPRSLYAVGPLVDVGVYPLTILTAFFGPARRVQAYAATLEPERRLQDGTPFTPEAPDWVTAVVEHEGGIVTRVTASFYVPASRQRGIELHGDDGSLWMPTWAEANSRVLHQPRGGEYEEVPLVREPFAGIDWSRALVDLAHAVREDRPHRMSGEHGAHVVEVLEAAETSLATGAPVAVHSSFHPPEPLEWAR
ncbi:MAG TPA: Gfo/Idh/MocA family oxidoreductase [Gaiellaceae bacterium]|nr:Gfo/Idh/MocA family oxidoreductase [Gaiellaceae bacterium]